MTIIIWLGRWSFKFEVWQFVAELNSRYVFALCFNSWGIEVWRNKLVEISKLEPLMWRIKLPFIRLTNTDIRKVIQTGTSSYRRVFVWNGKVFWKSINVF